MISDINLLTCIAAQQCFHHHLFVTDNQLRRAVPWIKVMVPQVLCHHIHSVNNTTKIILLILTYRDDAHCLLVHFEGRDMAMCSLLTCFVYCFVQLPSWQFAYLIARLRCSNQFNHCELQSIKPNGTQHKQDEFPTILLHMSGEMLHTGCCYANIDSPQRWHRSRLFDLQIVPPA